VDYVQYETLKKAMKSGDWNAAKEFLKRQPDSTGAKISYFDETALHLAVKAGHVDIVEKLVDLMSEEDLAIQTTFGNTALSISIDAENYMMVACMLRKNNNLLNVEDSNNDIPVNKAIFSGHIELARYLYSLTPLEDLTQERRIHGATLCTQAIYNRSLGKKQRTYVLFS
jgi:ankyrin repeat protein